MDGGALANENLIEATRNFVCIRLATYEDKEEAKFLKTVFRTRSGDLENTTFAILSPDGNKKLARAGRSIDQVLGPPNRAAVKLIEIAKKYSSSLDHPVDTERQIPYMKSVRLALNVASAESLPLAIVVAPAARQDLQIERTLMQLISEEDLLGQFVFSKAKHPNELAAIQQIEKAVDWSAPVLLLVQPGKFGMDGKVLESLSIEYGTEQIHQTMLSVIRNLPRPHKDHRSHVRKGIALNLDWESEIPESDPQSARARRRVRGGR